MEGNCYLNIRLHLHEKRRDLGKQQVDVRGENWTSWDEPVQSNCAQLLCYNLNEKEKERKTPQKEGYRSFNCSTKSPARLHI